MKQFVVVMALLLVWVIVAPLSRKNNPDVESITAAVYPEESELPDFNEMRVVYTVETPDGVVVRVVDNENYFFFSPSSVTIYKGYEKLCTKRISNDGKMLHEYNFEAEWDEGFVYLTMKGEEQSDYTLSIPIN